MMASEQIIQEHTQEVEYLKELARLTVVAILSSVDLQEMLDDPGAFVDQFLAAVLSDLSDYADQVTTAAQSYADTLGLAEVPDGEIQGQQDQAKDRFIEFARPALVAALLLVDERVQRMIDEGIAPSVITRALETDTTQSALLSSFSSVAKTGAAAFLQDVERSTITLAAQLLAQSAEADGEVTDFTWIAVMDSSTCDDVFENSCAPRHNSAATLVDWNDAGQPGAPNLICSIFARGATSYCRCVLEPSGVSAVNPLLNPVYVIDAIRAGRARAVLIS
jgi:hypothetical protein